MRLKSLRTILVLLFVLSISFQTHAQRRNKCPEYMWAVEYIPVTYLGFDKAPAAILSVSWGNNEVDGKFPINIEFRNDSTKNFEMLKFDWYLFEKYAYENTQAKDWETFLKEITLSHGKISIADTGEFEPKARFEPLVKLPCEEIYEKVGSVDINELIKKKNELIMEFVVTEILYSDGSNWQRN